MDFRLGLFLSTSFSPPLFVADNVVSCFVSAHLSLPWLKRKNDPFQGVMDADAVSLEELVKQGIVVQQAVGGDGAVQFQAAVGADDDDDDHEDEAPAGDVAPSATPIPAAILMPPLPPPPRSKSGKEPVTATGYQAPPDSDRVTKVYSKRSREASGGVSKDKDGKRRRGEGS